MRAKKLLTLAGCMSITAAFASAPMEPRSEPKEPSARPLLDADGRPAPGNVIGKGDPKPKPDGGVR
jgi:hypothetical protein